VRGNCSSPVELLKPGGVCVSVELPNLMDSLSFFLWNLSLGLEVFELEHCFILAERL
jgi:hypothetical protein